MARLTALLLSAAIAVPLAVRAQTRVPALIAHTGRLHDGEDNPVTGSKRLKFAIYEEFQRDPTNPHDPIWSDAYDVQLSGQGIYQVVLGDTVAGVGHTPLALGAAGANLFLAVEIDGVELSPRLRVASSPYALRAGDAEHSADLECAGCVAAADLGAGAVVNAKIADGTIEVGKLKNTAGHVVDLDADLLDGLDATDFAPASIETQIDSISTSVGTTLASDLGTAAGVLGATATSVGTGLAGKVDGLVTSLGTGASGKLDAISTSVGSGASGKLDTISTSLGSGAAGKLDAISTSVGSGASGKLDTISTSLGTGAAGKLDKLLQRMEYSQSCTDSWVAGVWGATGDATGKQACLRDGRWHLVLDLTNPGAPVGTVADLQTLVDAGASVRVTTAFTINAFDCERIEKRSSGRLVCVASLNIHPGSGMGPGGSSHVFHFISMNIDTDGVNWYGAHTAAGDGAYPDGRSCAGEDCNTWGKNWQGDANAGDAKFWVRF